MLRLKLASILLPFALLAGGNPAFACRVSHLPDYTEMLEADAIFVGEMVDYQRVKSDYQPEGRGDRGPVYAYAAITFRVDEQLQGAVPDEVNIRWYNSTFGIPEEYVFDGRQIVSVVDDRMDRASAPSDGFPDFFHMFQRPCSSPLNAQASDKNIATVKGWIADGAVDPNELPLEFEEVVYPDVSSHADQARDTHWFRAAILSALAIAALGAAAFAFRKNGGEG